MGHGVQDPAESEGLTDWYQHRFGHVRLGSPSNQSNGPGYDRGRISTGPVGSGDFRPQWAGDVSKTIAGRSLARSELTAPSEGVLDAGTKWARDGESNPRFFCAPILHAKAGAGAQRIETQDFSLLSGSFTLFVATDLTISWHESAFGNSPAF